jgi:uncharacterized protein YqeY
MSGLKEKLESEMISAAKSRDKLRLSTIRMIRSSIKYKEIDSKKELADSDIVNVIVGMAKQRNDSVESFKKGGRDDLVAKEEAELIILKEFLPPQMSKEDIRAKTEEVIKNIGASGLQDLGKVMKEIMPLLQGRAQGKEVSAIVKDLLST